MKKVFHTSKSRGTADFGWLKARYSFSFANYFDPERLHFGMLRVLNDDTIAPGAGFGQHPHDNMEIITIPLSGALRHRDSLNNEGIIESGEIQIMSAGSGIEHSEKNASSSQPLNLLQIWVIPNEENITPRYDQKRIAPLLKENQISTIIKPKNEARPGELWLQQDAYLSLGIFSESTEICYELTNTDHGVYVFAINGTVMVENETLNERDGTGLWEIDGLSLKAEKNSKILITEVPMNQ